MRPGQLIADRFEVQRLAGAGGMGSVYRAVDRATGASVALKVLVDGDPHDQRFAQEAELLATLRSPAVVRYVAHGATPEGRRYLAMEWLDGVDLAAKLRASGVTLAECVALGRRVAEALAEAHARGVVHRDVKPSNVFLPDGEVAEAKLIDFGIARVPHAHSMTRTGAVVGTPGYLAPEQARGGAVSPASDVFSLGCVFFEAVAGRRPFVGDHFVAVLAKILAEEAPSLRELRAEVPADLDALIARMLAKDPADRPRDGAAVAAALREIETAAEGAASARPAAPAITAREQRLVSVILVAQDGGGDAAQEATLASAELAALVARMREVAAPFGASVEGIVGGAVLATIARADDAARHATRAARCALALRAARPDVAAVLATGRATLADRVPVGAVIDRAALWVREMRAAGERALVVDEVTAGLLDARFALRPADGGRGLALLGELDAAPTPRTLLGRPLPCVGRERELALLDGVWAACVEGAAPQSVLVTGPPGQGKSRLRQEFLARLAARPDAPAVWTTEGDPVGAHSPFGLLARWVRRAASLHDADSGGARRKKLRARLSLALSGDALDRAAAFLGEVVGAGQELAAHPEVRAARRDPSLMLDQLARAFGAWLEAEAAAAPVVLVIDDLQWGDRASVRVIERAVAGVSERAVLLLALARPEAREVFTSEFQGDGAVSLALGPLGRRACERLAREALGDAATDALVARVIERAEGNALFLEELVRAAAAGETDVAPETVLAVVSARLDRLDATSRRALRAASVFGVGFDAAGVRALLGEELTEASLDALLRRLAREEVLVARGDGFALRHALLRDASYALLTDGDRALGHRLAGEWLVEAGADDPAALAEHFSLGERPALAARWYVRAAERALAGSALADALRWSERARDCGAAGEVLGAALGAEARARSMRDENARAAVAGEQALALLRAGSAAWHDAAADLATTSLRAGEHARLAAVARALAAVTPEGDATDGRVIALSRTAIHLLQVGRNAEADVLRAGLDALPAEAALDATARAWLGRLRAVEALHAGDPSAYLARTERVAEAFRDAGDRASACAQRGNVGYAYLELGDYPRAVSWLRGALADAEAIGVLSTAGMIRHNLGLALARAGAPEEGARVEREAAEAFAAQGNRRLEGYARAYLARILTARGEAVAAAEEARRALACLAEIAPARGFAAAALAEALLAAGDVPGARAAAAEAADVLRALGGIDEGEALIRLMDAETLRASGARDEARAALTEAASRLSARAARISDAALRQCFLTQVPENARTLALRGCDG